VETALVSKARSYSEQALSKLSPDLTFHNLRHTSNVVKAAEEIAAATQLSSEDTENVLVSAWFHDVGYQMGCEDHENKSSQLATNLLHDWGVKPEKIEAIVGAIKSTRMPQHPESRMAEVLCDADLHHLGDDNIFEIGNNLRAELSKTKGINYSDEEWLEHNLNFFKKHSYFTEYGKTVLQERKQKNIQMLKKEKPEKHKKRIKELEKENEKFRKQLDKKVNPERGIETMFRIASDNHTTLSGMADTKSNIMISINSIILSVIITVLFRKFEEFPYLFIPTLLLVSVCLVTIIFAVLATRPKITNGKFTKADVQEKRANLLFFGNFHEMSLADYEAGVREMMGDRDFLYGSLMKDIYYNGKVLARKYKMLRVAYTIFMYGFALSIISFIVALVMFGQPGS
jgi:predicted metal-dependent HD superfamily phosphohydrolase